jgi:hypothetical protein
MKRDGCERRCERYTPLLELAALNLAFNARDAMPNGGVLTIEAHDVAIGAKPGDATVTITLPRP